MSLVVKRFLEILVRVILEKNIDGREMFNKSYVIVKVFYFGFVWGVRGCVRVYMCICV